MRASIHFTPTHVVAQCPIGHLLTARQLDRTFGGSRLEAELTAHAAGQPNIFDRMAARCDGTGT